uniref:Uncharacterized protein n=1 Tax=Zonotrichia albicollis TaxID=44394 RepID=A0A8D2MIR5_ZONAL
TEDLAEQALLALHSAGLEEGKVKEPLLASECNELPKAEKWRRQITGEISKKVAHPKCCILLTEKGHWECRKRSWKFYYFYYGLKFHAFKNCVLIVFFSFKLLH